MASPVPAVVELPRLGDARGSLSFLEAQRHVPFAIGSAFWWRAGLPDPGGDGQDGGVALVALRGSARVDVEGSAPVRIDRADRALVLPAGSRWSLDEPSHDAVVAGVSSGASADREAPGPMTWAPPPGGLSTVDDCRLVDLPHAGGTPAVGARARFEPFGIERLYWLYEVPGTQSRGSHAHRELQQLIVAASGSFEIRLDDGASRRTIVLDRPDRALYVPRLIWRDLSAFRGDAVCLVVASMPYAVDDYLRDYPEYLRVRAAAAGA